MKTQEDASVANHEMLQDINTKLNMLDVIAKRVSVIRLFASGSGRWLGNLLTTAIGGGIIALIYHVLASWH